MKLSKKENEIIYKCFELVERDHGSCDEEGCDLRMAIESGNDAWAIYLWDHSGASCDEFNELYNKLDQKRFYPVASKQCDEILKENA